MFHCKILRQLITQKQTISRIGWNLIRIKAISKGKASFFILRVGQDRHGDHEGAIAEPFCREQIDGYFSLININQAFVRIKLNFNTLQIEYIYRVDKSILLRLS